ncbi:hypothetical protein WQQ_43070 [Hydrocarboniphaga effusa AP103]|uniref:Uncharacterized protein n=1 Tax=Hydrocarboniphaga effusa AP103 TaxID=1172194 RepID=I7Z887_9GAMM|nr:hypothetical protein WQQ_43070 [Hydrocarboniphaga effusa AP103]
MLQVRDQGLNRVFCGRHDRDPRRRAGWRAEPSTALRNCQTTATGCHRCRRTDCQRSGLRLRERYTRL